MGATASSLSQGWKNAIAAMLVAPRNVAAQRDGTATRSQREAEMRGHTAEANRMAMGASTTTIQRHGNCRKRSLGSRVQTGNETGSKSTSTATGMSPSGS